jgi:hypothetical protein
LTHIDTHVRYRRLMQSADFLDVLVQWLSNLEK